MESIKGNNIHHQTLKNGTNKINAIKKSHQKEAIRILSGNEKENDFSAMIKLTG